jgi:hypothetical protein
MTDTYRALILERLQARDGTPIPNGTIAHAALLVEAMFKNASDKIRILTGELNARVYGAPEIVAAARQFLADADHSLEIIFECEFNDNDAARHPLLAALGPGANVTLWRLEPKFRQAVTAHFALMDEDSYRYEADKTKDSAVAAFGDREFTESLIRLFENMKAKACVQFRMPVFA